MRLHPVIPEEAVMGEMTDAAPAAKSDTAPASSPGRGRAVSLIVPAMNEAANLEWVLSRVPDCVTEVIVVDGYSTDDTIATAVRIRPDARVVYQQGRGKGSALRTGFAAATGDYVVMIDADGSMHPREIDLFVAALDRGYEFIKGSRFLPEGGSEDITRLRSLGNHALKTSVNIMFLVPFSDLCYGFMAFRRSCLEQLRLTAQGFEIETEMAIHAVKAGLRIAEVPSMELSRRNGVSNLHTFRDGQRVLRTLVRERVSRRRRPVVDWLQFPPAMSPATPYTSPTPEITDLAVPESWRTASMGAPTELQEAQR